MRRWHAGVGAVAVAALLALAAAPASGGHATWYAVASWQMNEKPKQTVLRDATGNGFVGHIGGKVTPTKQRFHRFSRVAQALKVPGRLDVVPDNDALDPSFSDFMVQVSVRFTTQYDRNIVQKGQGSPAGGMFKMKVQPRGRGNDGQVACLFRGSNGDSFVTSGVRLDDGTWHLVECARDVNGVTMFVDGEFVALNDNQPGSISNDWPVAIGGNTVCRTGGAKRCNYWQGDIGKVVFYDS